MAKISVLFIDKKLQLSYSIGTLVYSWNKPGTTPDEIFNG